MTNLADFDTGIAIWRQKRKHDAVRPFTAIKFIWGNKNVTAWGGPGKGTVSDLPASQWTSYLWIADHPEYPSGAASVCAAQVTSSRLYFGDDNLGYTFTFRKGTSYVEPGITPPVDTDITYNTWT